MEERKACAQLRARFEAAGFTIQENRTFDEAGVRFEMDGFDPKHRVGYEYVTGEAGDGWDVDDTVIAALAERRKKGELHVLVVDEAAAPDAAALDRAIETFFTELRAQKVLPLGGKQPPAKPAAKAAAKPPPPPPPKKPAGAKPKPKPKR
jgi:hypothetical protein